jgi:hypothetical protein
MQALSGTCSTIVEAISAARVAESAAERRESASSRVESVGKGMMSHQVMLCESQLDGSDWQD